MPSNRFYDIIEDKIKRERNHDELLHFSILKQMGLILQSYSDQEMTKKQSDEDFQNLINFQMKIWSLFDFHLQDQHIRDYLLMTIARKEISVEDVKKGLSKCQDQQKFIGLFKQLISLSI